MRLNECMYVGIVGVFNGMENRMLFGFVGWLVGLFVFVVVIWYSFRLFCCRIDDDDDDDDDHDMKGFFL